MKGIIQKVTTVTVPFKGVLTGAPGNDHFQLRAGEVFSVDNTNGARYPSRTLGRHYVLAMDFDSRIDKVMVGWLDGMFVPALLAAGAVAANPGVSLGLHATLPRLSTHEAGQPILATVEVIPNSGITQVSTKFIPTEAPTP